MQISIITSLFNRLDLTRVYLQSLERTLRGWQYEVILIDDVSTDGTREFLDGLADPRYRVVLNDTQQSFAANNNAGARLARGPLLCFLNNDTILLPGWLEPMVQLARRVPDVAVVGNVQREPVGGLIDHYGFYFNAEGDPIHAGKGAAVPPVEPYLSWPALTAACWVIRKEIFLGLGGFDEAFHNGFEDLDFCLRAGAAGFRHFTANRSVIYHHISATPGRKRREDTNLQLFRQRWQDWLATAARTRKTAASVRAEGWRYLRKHLARPWRYNLWRLCDAAEKVCVPRPASREPNWLARLIFRWRPLLPSSSPPPAGASAAHPPTTKLFLVVSETVRDAGYSGVPTLVRSLAAAYGRLGLPVRLVTWNARSRSLSLLPAEFSMGADAEALRDPLPDASRAHSAVSLYDPRSSCLDEPSASEPALHEIPRYADTSTEAWVLMPELMYAHDEAAHLVEYVHRWRWKLAVVFHDAIPLNAPAFAESGEPMRHVEYMRFFAGADQILPVSEWSAHEWRSFVALRGYPQGSVAVCTPGNDTFVRTRGTPLPLADPATPVRILSVSMVGARKNHRVLLDAFERAVAARPDLSLELLLVGAPRLGYDNLPAAIHDAMARHPGKIRWIKRADYAALRNFFEACDFTIYPSELEGYGLPVQESLWFCRPCVCANVGPMAATATGGGCVVVDVRDPQAMADVIVTLASSPERRRRLSAEASARPLKTWEEYAAELFAVLHGSGKGAVAGE